MKSQHFHDYTALVTTSSTSSMSYYKHAVMADNWHYFVNWYYMNMTEETTITPVDFLGKVGLQWVINYEPKSDSEKRAKNYIMNDYVNRAIALRATIAPQSRL